MLTSGHEEFFVQVPKCLKLETPEGSIVRAKIAVLLSSTQSSVLFCDGRNNNRDDEAVWQVQKRYRRLIDLAFHAPHLGVLVRWRPFLGILVFLHCHFA